MGLVGLFLRERVIGRWRRMRERGKRRGEFDQRERAVWPYAYQHRPLRFVFTLVPNL